MLVLPKRGVEPPRARVRDERATLTGEADLAELALAERPHILLLPAGRIKGTLLLGGHVLSHFQ